LTETHGKKSTAHSPSTIYRETFRCRCFQLIHTGYSRLEPAALHDAEEPAVTGELVCAIQGAMDCADALEWYSQFAVHDNPPLNVSGKQGKNRPQADMEFEHTSSRPRFRYRIEAKWVGEHKTSLGSAKGYLGDEGIGCFLSGKYPADNQQAGMLAYVHSDDEVTWAEKIQAGIEAKKRPLRIKDHHNKVWEKDKIQEPFHAYISEHCVPADTETPLRITHLLLCFL
jgi:hypothetical protein